MWEISNSLQILSFARSLVLGILICLIYDILRAKRHAVKSTVVAIFFEDIIFSVLTAFITFLFLLSITNGEMRGFVFFGMAIGFLISRISISFIWFKILNYIFINISNGYVWLFKRIYSGFDYVSENIAYLFKKSKKRVKKVLKKLWCLLYTKEDRKV